MSNLFLILLPVTLYCSGCLKADVVLPPSKNNYDPQLDVNFKLSRLLDLAPAEGKPVLLDSDWVAACIVQADDESGNFYNQLVLEDSGGGIALLINENSLYTRYPIGRKLYLSLRGLYLGNYNGTLQLGSVPVPDNSGVLQVSDIPARVISGHITAAGTNNLVKSLPVDMNSLKVARPDLANRLIQLMDVELSDPNTDNTYSDAMAATSIRLRNCAGVEIILRTSNYARFQASATPKGKGTLTAVYSIYKGTGQLMMRDTPDAHMAEARCDGSTIVPPALLNIGTLRMMYQGKDTLIGNYIIRAVVTSDVINKNFGSGNIIVQQGGKAITVYFGSSATGLPLLSDSIELNLSGSILTKYNDVLEVKNIKANKIKVLTGNVPVEPVTITLADLNAQFSNYESVLVRIRNGKISSAGKFAGSRTLDDGTGTIVLYTSSSALFADESVPTITKTFQGIATPYGTTKELKLRNPGIDIY